MLQELVLNKFSKAKETLAWALLHLKHKLLNLRPQERIVDQNNNEPFLYTEDQLMARLKFFIGICLAMTLTGIVFVVLYSIIFITQPLNAISPIDQKFFEMIIPIATFLTGTLSGIMLAGGDKDLKAKALDAANRPSQGYSQFPSTPAGLAAGIAASALSSAGAMSGSTFNRPTRTGTTSVTVVEEVVNSGPPIAGFGGKLGPPPAPQPEI
jgi:hypothetical protein